MLQMREVGSRIVVQGPESPRSTLHPGRPSDKLFGLTGGRPKSFTKGEATKSETVVNLAGKLGLNKSSWCQPTRPRLVLGAISFL